MLSLLEQGERIGSYVFLIDADGLRHAVRSNSVIVASDSDVSRDETVLQVGGGRVIRVAASLDEVLHWFGAEFWRPRTKGSSTRRPTL